jgi:hypothetical protein
MLIRQAWYVYQLLLPAGLKKLPERSESDEWYETSMIDLDVEGSGSSTSFEGI